MSGRFCCGDPVSESNHIAPCCLNNCDRVICSLQGLLLPRKGVTLGTNKPGIKETRETADLMKSPCRRFLEIHAMHRGDTSGVTPGKEHSVLSHQMFKSPTVLKGVGLARSGPLLRTLRRAYKSHSCSSDVPTRPRALASSGVRPLFKVLRRDLRLALERFLSRGTTR